MLTILSASVNGLSAPVNGLSAPVNGPAVSLLVLPVRMVDCPQRGNAKEKFSTKIFDKPNLQPSVRASQVTGATWALNLQQLCSADSSRRTVPDRLATELALNVRPCLEKRLRR